MSQARPLPTQITKREGFQMLVSQEPQLMANQFRVPMFQVSKGDMHLSNLGTLLLMEDLENLHNLRIEEITRTKTAKRMDLSNHLSQPEITLPL
jgi:hypothetical protein